ncbi:carbon-nitrogen hydrolase family protein [Allokutzneria sp. A3M-2-11 16]|uniref:carbon-nitrogen hydrolase family protein n=1 Tax=Allokutzneria sp. A3M-2-11 16 TaxID=2962043 RepID=UPI0020B7166D|nr:carbon-nitrogen hydrolase family protein [Allokutzneria sp. A3M-2-11 16]MCP3802610.1 carbon-nitrogen hydrolase family protein [Allokutzneria sp. A3M-2-11 16]
MREPLVIAVAQPLCASHEVAANAKTHAETVRAADARVVVFPELSLTGYELDAEVVPVDDPRLEPLVEACAETGSVALVGAPVPGKHIAMLAVDASGVTVAYKKVNLHGEETRLFVPGEPVVFTVDGWRLGLAICRDTGVPQHASDTAALGIDAYVAGVVEDRPDIIAERAQRTATTHEVYVAVSSFAGPTGGGFSDTAARSGVWAPDGTLIAFAGTDIGAVARAQLS